MSVVSRISLQKNHACMCLRPTQSVMDMRPMQKKAEKLNGRTAMLGFAAALIEYATSGSVFFFGVLGF